MVRLPVLRGLVFLDQWDVVSRALESAHGLAGSPIVPIDPQVLAPDGPAVDGPAVEVWCSRPTGAT